MSLKKKFDRIFAMGFQLGVAACTPEFNGATYKDASDADEDDTVNVEGKRGLNKWERKYLSEVEAALKEFREYAEKNRL